MKKILLITLTAVFGFMLAACDNKPVMVFYNWGEYIDNDLVKEFEKEEGIKVKQVLFTSNELAITKILGGDKYDLIIPSEYGTEHLIQLGLVEKIDWTKIDVFKQEDFAPGLKSLLKELKDVEGGYDFLEYSVPYFWGNVGLLYNKEVVKLEELQAKNWDILKDEKYKVSLYDTSREGLLVPLKQLGYSMNTSNQSEINEGVKWLTSLKDSKGAKLSFITDKILDDMLLPNNMKYDISVSYSGDAVSLMGENDKLGYYVPTNGTNVWVDGMVIPKTANQEYAYKFINFISKYENAKQNSEWIGYTSPFAKLIQELTSAGGAFEASKDSYDIQFNLEKDQLYRHDEKAKQMIDDAWNVVKAR